MPTACCRSISYKVGGDIDGAVSGKFNAVAEQAATRLASYGLPTAVTFWHEPNPDVSGAQYVAASKQLLPIFKRGELRVGPLLNGWLLDNQMATWSAYCPDDSSVSGTGWVSTPTRAGLPSGRAGSSPPTGSLRWRRSRGPAGSTCRWRWVSTTGTAPQTIAQAGETLLSTPNVWFGCVFNSDYGAKGDVLDGDRLTAFRGTLADPRSKAARSVTA